LYAADFKLGRVTMTRGWASRYAMRVGRSGLFPDHVYRIPHLVPT